MKAPESTTAVDADALAGRPAMAATGRAGLPFIVWAVLGWYDVRTRYRRTFLGPLWLTLSMAVSVICLGFLYGTIFGQPLETFFPFITAGLVVWGWIAAILTEGSQTFIGAKFVLQNMCVDPLWVVVRIITRTTIMFAHNAVVLLVVMVLFDVPLTGHTLWVVPGIVAVALMGFSTAVVLAYLSARFRDVPQVVVALINVLFLATPIIWESKLLGTYRFLADFNPLTHFIALVRDPALGMAPDGASLAWVGCSTLAMAVLAWAVHASCRRRLVFWL